MTVRISNMTATFTDSTIDYDAIGMDVTDTASGANSTLINLKLANSSVMNVNKNGTLTVSTVVANGVISNVLTADSVVANSLTSSTITANSINLVSAVPSNSTATGIRGQIATDSSFIYVCTANNTWKRSALTAY